MQAIQPLAQSLPQPSPTRLSRPPLSPTQAEILSHKDQYQSDSRFPWPTSPPGPLSASLLEQSRKASPAEIQALLKAMPLMGSQGLFSPGEERSPHHIIRTTLAPGMITPAVPLGSTVSKRALVSPVTKKN